MRVRINGEWHDLGERARVADAVAALGVGPDRSGVAVARNGEVVAREDWHAVDLADGDRVEVLTAVAGGAG